MLSSLCRPALGCLRFQSSFGSPMVLCFRDVRLFFHGFVRHHRYALGQLTGSLRILLRQVAAVFVGSPNFVALAVNDFALFVGNVVVFQTLFAHIEVSAFDFALRPLDLARQQVVFDGNAAFGGDAVEDAGGAVECE